MAKRGLSESEVLALRPVRLAEWSEAVPAPESERGADSEPGAGAARETGGGTGDLPAAAAAPPLEAAEAAGRVTLERPLPPVRGLRSLLARISALTGVKRVRLDEHGSYLWRRIDGERTVDELAEALSQEFGEAVEPAGERVALFLRSLDREHLVELRDAGGAQVKLGRV